MQKTNIFSLAVLFLFCFAQSGHSQNNPIVFSSDRSGNYEIYTMGADGTNLTKITNHSGTDRRPVLTPDGKNIIFASNRDGDFEIYSISTNGTNLHQLTNNTAYDDDPAISLQGKLIAFDTYQGGDWEIYIMNSDGTNQHNITKNTVSDTFPSWSPDGKYLVYHTQLISGNWEIFKRQADGSAPLNLTNHSSRDFFPSISPDGKHVVFWSDRSGSYQIYQMSPDGGGLTQITTTAPQPDLMSKVAWSPDSKTILFPQSHDIYSMRLDGTGLINITRAAGVDSHPDWTSNDFHWTLFKAAIGGVPPTRSIVKTKNRLIADFGENGAVRAMMLASDKGYSLSQIVAAVHGGQLAANGDITGQNPAFAPFNLYIDDMATNDAGSFISTSGNEPMAARAQQRISVAIDRANQAANALHQPNLLSVNIILGLNGAGYTVEQITEALFFDYHIAKICNPGKCFGFLLIDPSTGKIIAPAGVKGYFWRNDWDGRPTGQTYNCVNGRIISADLVCNGHNNCGDGSDETEEKCGSEASCCILTGGCPSERSHTCGEFCCCCPDGQVCDRDNPANGCINSTSIQQYVPGKDFLFPDKLK